MCYNNNKTLKFRASIFSKINQANDIAKFGLSHIGFHPEISLLCRPQILFLPFAFRILQAILIEQPHRNGCTAACRWRGPYNQIVNIRSATTVFNTPILPENIAFVLRGQNNGKYYKLWHLTDGGELSNIEPKSQHDSHWNLKLFHLTEGWNWKLIYTCVDIITSNVVNTIFSMDPKYRSHSICVCCRSAKILVADIDRTISGTFLLENRKILSACVSLFLIETAESSGICARIKNEPWLRLTYL